MAVRAVMLDRWAGAFLVFLLFLATAPASAEPTYPTLTGRVVDQAGLLSSQVRIEIEGRLAAHEQAAGNQVVVVTVKSLQGVGIEEYGVGLGRHWGIGEKGKDNGVLLIVAPDEREVRIEVGYGLEGALTDAISSQIVRNDILPHFRAGNMSGGIVAGARSILRALEGDYVASTWSADSTEVLRKPSLIVPDWVGFAFIGAVWLVILLPIGKRRWRVGSSSDSDVGDDSSSSSSSFSGSGGSFGGGGASGRW